MEKKRDHEAMIVVGRSAVDYVMHGDNIPPDFVASLCVMCGDMIVLSPEGSRQLETAGRAGYPLCTSCVDKVLKVNSKNCTGKDDGARQDQSGPQELF